MDKPEKKVTHEDGTGHNCDVKGCPMCWNDGYNQAIDDMNAWIDSADIENVIKLSSWSQIKLMEHKDVEQAINDMDELAKAIRTLLRGE